MDGELAAKIHLAKVAKLGDSNYVSPLVIELLEAILAKLEEIREAKSGISA